MNALYLRTLITGIILAGTALAETTPEPIPVRLKVEDFWVELPSTPDAPESGKPVFTHAAANVKRHLDPDSGEPYVAWPHSSEPAQVRKQFLLEQREFLLGEPILVEYRVTVEGPGSFREKAGGNYRSRGRDDNFLFLLRREDGTWVGDVHPFAGGIGGGLGGGVSVDAARPHSL